MSGDCQEYRLPALIVNVRVTIQYSPKHLLLSAYRKESHTKETDFAHGCDSADVAAKSSSVTIKSKYKTSFWEEVFLCG